MSEQRAFPRPIVFGRDYWLCRCEGFRVDCPVGRVGLVEELRFGSRIDCPDWLVVRGGLLGNRRLIVSVTDVAEVVPRQELIMLHDNPQPSSAHERVARLRDYLAATFARRRNSFAADRST